MSAVMMVLQTNNVIITSSTPSSNVVTAGLMVNLSTAPTSGTTWIDTSGYGRNATLQGNTSYVSGNNGGIRLVNSTASSGTGYINVPYNISSNTATIEIVASFNPTSYWATVWANETYNSGTGYFAYMTGSTSINWAGSGSSISATNGIRHYIFVINGTSKILYQNGTQISTASALNPVGWSTNNFYFGARHTNAGTNFTDTMNNSTAGNQPVFYQMRIYNKALSASEVTQNYNEMKLTYPI